MLPELFAVLLRETRIVYLISKRLPLRMSHKNLHRDVNIQHLRDPEPMAPFTLMMNIPVSVDDN